MNLGELYAELRLLLGNVSSSAISDTRLTLWLNNAETELASAFQFFSTEKRATAGMVVGQTEYSLPTDCIAIYDLRDNTEKRKIRRAHYRKFDNIDVSVTGDPATTLDTATIWSCTPLPMLPTLCRLGTARP